jgi:starch synthase (maltosyl-transferring)
LPATGRIRPTIESVRPAVDHGRFPSKATLGDQVVVTADAFCDGHDLVWCEIGSAPGHDRRWSWHPMEPLGNDAWSGIFLVDQLGTYRFKVRASIDRFGTWRHDLAARVEAGQDVVSELAAGAELLAGAATRARGPDRELLVTAAERLANAPSALETGLGDASSVLMAATVGDLVFGDRLAEVARRHQDPDDGATSAPLSVLVDPVRARFSTWYEMFPRSTSPDPARHGTFADVRDRLGYVARLGFDVLYLPPIHPIGRTNRKGPDGSPEAAPTDPGSPWAIGAAEGGHMAVHPSLGTISEFEQLVAAAAERGIEVAIDLALQCSPDHPWVREHPEWFRHRPDGSIRFAENPPKRYEDIYPLDFETESWRELWREILRVVQFWINHGVRTFRVDNPHTKPFAFWEWLIATVKAEDPEVVFLSEAFTRPKVMYRLAKLGFTQSYTYFAWRNEKWELEQYLTELTQTEVAEFFRPNFWPNTPDILTESLQHGGTSAFLVRLVLAATLAASYGIYGPPFELQEHVARSPGSEEYRGSEKYAQRHWDLGRPDTLADFVARVNEIRRRNPALQHNATLRFHAVDNERIIAYSKTATRPFDERGGGQPGDAAPNVVLVVANLDFVHVQTGWTQLDLSQLGLESDVPFEMHDLVTDARYRWQGPRNFVQLDPGAVPFHVFSVRSFAEPPSTVAP